MNLKMFHVKHLRGINMSIYNSPIFTVDAKETRRYAGLQKADFSEAMIEDACSEAQLLIQPARGYQSCCGWRGSSLKRGRQGADKEKPQNCR